MFDKLQTREPVKPGVLVVGRTENGVILLTHSDANTGVAWNKNQIGDNGLVGPGQRVSEF